MSCIHTGVYSVQYRRTLRYFQAPLYQAATCLSPADCMKADSHIAPTHQHMVIDSQKAKISPTSSVNSILTFASKPKTKKTNKKPKPNQMAAVLTGASKALPVLNWKCPTYHY